MVGIGGLEASELQLSALVLYDGESRMRTLGLCQLPAAAVGALQPVLGALGEPIELVSCWGEQRGRLWRPLPPTLVAEVTATHVDRGRLRQPARFERWWPDREPEDCRQDQPSRNASSSRSASARMS